MRCQTSGNACASSRPMSTLSPAMQQGTKGGRRRLPIRHGRPRMPAHRCREKKGSAGPRNNRVPGPTRVWTCIGRGLTYPTNKQKTLADTMYRSFHAASSGNSYYGGHQLERRRYVLPTKELALLGSSLWHSSLADFWK